MSVAPPDLSSRDPNVLQSGSPVSPRTSRLATWILVAMIVGFVAFMVLSATVLKSDELPGVSFDELKSQPIYAHQPPDAEDTRLDQGDDPVPGGTANRWVLRAFRTPLSATQVRDWYLRRFGTTYRIDTSSANDTSDQYVLRGEMALSEATRAVPPVLSVRVAIGRTQRAGRTHVTLSIQSDR